ncbi:MAG: hypothetical protein JNL60_18475 [Bacteroidia bacterium]|nr:hypothetical protein [Bacteroidia bacterium]
MSKRNPADERPTSANHKVLLIPFEPKLYNSEIDRFINAETKLTAREIKHKFRDGLNEQFYKSFKAQKFGVIDMMEDTVKFKKDLEGIYQYIRYEYVKIPDQNNYKAPVKEKEEKKIEKGQLAVETNSDQRFMDARFSSPKVVSVLQSKYKTDLFICFNQLDILNSGSKGPMDLGTGSPNRKIVLHYTVFNSAGKEINSGTVEQEFEPELNNPKKIIDKYFSKISLVVLQRVNKCLNITG